MIVWRLFAFATLKLFGEYTEVGYITYTMAAQDSPDIYAKPLKPATLRVRHYIRKIPQGHGITITYNHNVIPTITMPITL